MMRQIMMFVMFIIACALVACGDLQVGGHGATVAVQDGDYTSQPTGGRSRAEGSDDYEEESSPTLSEGAECDDEGGFRFCAVSAVRTAITAARVEWCVNREAMGKVKYSSSEETGHQPHVVADNYIRKCSRMLLTGLSRSEYEVSIHAVEWDVDGDSWNVIADVLHLSLGETEEPAPEQRPPSVGNFAVSRVPGWNDEDYASQILEVVWQVEARTEVVVSLLNGEENSGRIIPTEPLASVPAYPYWGNGPMRLGDGDLYWDFSRDSHYLYRLPGEFGWALLEAVSPTGDTTRAYRRIQ